MSPTRRSPPTPLSITLLICVIVSETRNAQGLGSPVGVVAGEGGGIGCTFSPSVCDPDQEFCYNDNAFGRCVPLYGTPDESNFYRFSLTKPDAAGLEAVIEDLTSLGFRWNHAYTQCVLGHALNVIRYGWEGQQRRRPDCSEARAADELGSLVKELGKETDPFNLAFIKYRPGDEYHEDLYLPARAPAIEMDSGRRIEAEKELEAELENYILGGQENKLERVEDQPPPPSSRWSELPGGQDQDEIEFIQPKIFSPIYNTPDLFREGVESRDELQFLPDSTDQNTNLDFNNVPKTPPAAHLSPSGEELLLPPKLEFFVDDHDARLQQPNTIAKQLKELDDQLGSTLLAEEQQFHRFSVPRKGDKQSYFKAPAERDGVLYLGGGGAGRRHPVYLDTPLDPADYAQDEYPRDSSFEDAVLNGMVVDDGRGPFERHERLDVKKPGPWYRSVNNFAFDDDEEGKARHGQENKEPGWNFPMNPEFYGGVSRVGPILLPGAMQQQQRDLDVDEDLSAARAREKSRENMESLLKLTHKTGQPTTADSPLPKPSEALDIIDTSYINVVTGGRIGWNAARDLVNLLADLLDLKHSIFREVRVKENVVTFKVEPNDKSWDAGQIAKKIESFRSIVLKEADIKILKAEVGVRANLQLKPGRSESEPESAKTASDCLDGSNNLNCTRLTKRQDTPYHFMVDPTLASSSGPAALPLFDDADGLTRTHNLYIATFALCGGVAAIVVAAFTIYFVRKNSRSKAKFTKLGQDDPSMEACSKDYQDLCRARMASKNNEKPESHRAVQRVQSNISRDSDAGGTSSSRSSTSSWTEEPVLTNMDISTGHMVLSYMEDHLNNKSRLDQEWTALCAYEADPCTTAIAEKAENAKKNRYTNSVPYDHARVVLNELANISGCDYINASSITDHDPRNPAYIATQGPLQTTCADFWQMVWEQGSVVIVTLTRLRDNGTNLCHRYWPEEGSELHHIYEVHLVSEHIWCEDYLVRSFYLKNLKTGETRTVTQFHFLAWPENGIPSNTKTLLEFRRKVNKSYRGRSCPIIVHCSDGSGRTGTYCLIDMVLNRMSKGAKEIDIAASLEHIRDQRAGMVRTKQQFEFVLMAVAEEVHAILKALPQ